MAVVYKPTQCIVLWFSTLFRQKKSAAHHISKTGMENLWSMAPGKQEASYQQSVLVDQTSWQKRKSECVLSDYFCNPGLL